MRGITLRKQRKRLIAMPKEIKRRIHGISAINGEIKEVTYEDPCSHLKNAADICNHLHEHHPYSRIGRHLYDIATEEGFYLKKDKDGNSLLTVV